MLRYAADRSGTSLEMDLRDLQFLNSSGISTLSLFIIEMREVGKNVTITGSKASAWQTKSLSNFRRLYDKVVVNLVYRGGPLRASEFSSMNLTAFLRSSRRVARSRGVAEPGS